MRQCFNSLLHLFLLHTGSMSADNFKKSKFVAQLLTLLANTAGKRNGVSLLSESPRVQSCTITPSVPGEVMHCCCASLLGPCMAAGA